LNGFSVNTYAIAINDSGQITYFSNVSNTAYLYDNGHTTPLGSLGGGWTRAYDINNNGFIVGESQISSGHGHAFLWSNGTMTDTHHDTFNHSEGRSINQSGQILCQPGYIYDLNNGNFTILQNPTGYADWYNYPTDISDSGNATGTLRSPTVIGPSAYVGYLYIDGTMEILSVNNSTDTIPHSINNNNQIVGFWRDSFDLQHAYLYHEGLVYDIPTLYDGNYSEAWAINNKGQIVGSSTIDGHDTSYRHAFLYDDSGLMDLGVLDGATYSEAYGINENGWIVGVSGGGIYNDSHAVLWKPIPEPCTLLLFCLGVLALQLKRSR